MIYRNIRRVPLTSWIIISMVAGVLIGTFAPAFAMTLKPVSTVFLRMIKSIIVPLIFGTLVVGIAGHGDDMKRVGRLALKSIIYFEIITTLALFLGLLTVNVIKPGVGAALAAPAAGAAPLASEPVTFASVLEHIVPQSFFDAAAHNEMLQIVFWSVLFAIGLTQVRGRPKETMLGFCEAVAEVMFKFTGIVMKFAPFAVAAALAKAMERMEALGVPRRIVAFVMPTGYSFNLDGSTLYLSVASIFVAQASGVELTVGQQLLMMLTLLITSKGIAAVPRASLVVLS